MNLPFVWLSAKKDLVRRMRDPWALVFWIGLPLVIVSLILLAFGGQDAPPKARVLVADRDNSFLSQALVNAMNQVEVIETEPVGWEAGPELIEKTGATALLVIPDGFGENVLYERPVELALFTNPSQRILPAMVEETLDILADAAFYIQRTFGEEIATFREGPPDGATTFPSDVITAASGRINDRMGRVSEVIFPPRIELDAKIESTRPEGPTLGLGALFFPGVLFMALMFMAAGMASDVWIEREKGTLRRMIGTPQRVSDFLAGKVLAGAMLMAAISLVAIVTGVIAFGVPATAILPGTLWAAFAGTVFLVGIALIQLFASSARTAGVFTTMMLFPLLMVGGNFFPFEQMPAGLRAVGQATPNGWALVQLRSILWGGVDPASLGIAVALLAGVFAVAFLLAARRMRRGFAGA